MNAADRKAAEQVKQQNGTSQQQQQSQTTATEAMFGQAMDAMMQLADEMSETASDDLTDLTMALTIKKTAQKIGAGQWGGLTQRMMKSVKSGFLSPVKQKVLELEAEEIDPKYSLPTSTSSINYLEPSSERNSDSNGNGKSSNSSNNN